MKILIFKKRGDEEVDANQRTLPGRIKINGIPSKLTESNQGSFWILLLVIKGQIQDLQENIKSQVKQLKSLSNIYIITDFSKACNKKSKRNKSSVAVLKLKIPTGQIPKKQACRRATQFNTQMRPDAP